MAGTFRTLAACGVAVFCSVAISGDRRATATLRVSATVVAECSIDDPPSAAQPGCRPISRRVLHNVAPARLPARAQPSGRVEPVPTNGGSSSPLTVVFIRF